MYSKDGKSVKECKLAGNAWDISYNKKYGRIVVALQDNSGDRRTMLFDSHPTT
jgi:hypothetical protein